MLSKEEVKKIAHLARIELSEAEVEKFQKDLSVVLDYVEELKNAPVSIVGNLDPAHEVTGLVNVVREDKVEIADNHEEIFGQAPEIKDGYFKVKAIL